ncbi:MAG: VOC family protein [Negativicutes bacterium]|nr:VOC family protein [Negativicutes bacterium]
MFLGFEHAAIVAKETKMMADWYVKMFDFQVVADNGKSPATYMLKAPNATALEILPATSGEPADYDQLLVGIRHLSLAVDDFEAALKFLQDNGVSGFFDERRSERHRLMYFRDPEGNLLHLIWRAKPL